MNSMNIGARFTDLTSGPAGGLADGRFIVLDQDELDVGTLTPKLQTARLPDNDVVLVGAFTPEVATQVTRIVSLIMQQKEHSERLINAMFTPAVTVSSAAAQQALRNAEARQELLDEFGALGSEEVALLAGSTAKNRSATASRYVAAGQVFAVEHHGNRHYPVFQFGADGRPRPVIAQVLSALQPYGLDGWELALWFTTASGWLDDRRPVDLLDEAPEEVVAAALHTVDAVAG